jgi:hypothetical protein
MNNSKNLPKRKCTCEGDKTCSKCEGTGYFQLPVTEVSLKNKIEDLHFKGYIFRTHTTRLCYDEDTYRVEVEIILPNQQKQIVAQELSTRNLYNNKLERGIELVQNSLLDRLKNIMNDYIRIREEEELRRAFIERMKNFNIVEHVTVDKL